MTAQNAFGELKLHFTRATVTFDYAFKDYSEDELKVREDEPMRIDQEEPFRALMFDEVEPSQDTIKADEADLREFFVKFTKDGERWI